MKPNLRVMRLRILDIPDIHELIDDETARETNLESPFTLTNAEIFVTIYNTYGAWENNKLVGAFEIKKDGELSYLVHRDERQRGVASEMLKMAPSVARRIFQVNTMYCNISSKNIASLKTAQKLGFDVKRYD